MIESTPGFDFEHNSSGWGSKDRASKSTGLISAEFDDEESVEFVVSDGVFDCERVWERKK